MRERIVLRRLFAICGLATAAALVVANGSGASAETIRLGVQKTGSLAWEIEALKARELDKKAGLELEISDLANVEAGRIAVIGGSVDVVVSDWIWVSRERADGVKLLFAPYSSSLGGVMTAANSGISDIADLKGKRLGVGGGPLDKSWLMLRAYALRKGIDLVKEATIVYGAPPLLAEKTAQGELDASLLYWLFCADLELKGFKVAVDMRDVEKGLGARGDVAMVGYVFTEDFASKHAEALAKFFGAAREARKALADDPAPWPTILARRGVKDPRAPEVFRKRYADGAPARPTGEEEADARGLYKTLQEIGGKDLVGSAKELDPGAYYKPSP